jgi:diguanylate cyclase (GGDEF)-like protein
LRNWRDLLSSPEQDDELAREIRARRFRDCMRMIPLTAPANCALAAVGAWLFYEVTPPLLLLVCLLSTFVAEADSVWHYLRSKTGAHDIEDGDLRRIAIRVSIIGVSLLLPTVFWLPRVDADEQLLIITVIAGLIGLGGFVMSPIATAGISWTLCTTVIATVALASANRPVLWTIFALLIAYAVTLCAIVVATSHSLAARVRAEVRAERQRDLVDLLLKDFEGSSRDWLWETDRDGRLRHVSARLAETFARAASALEGHSLVDLLRTSFSERAEDAVESHDFLQLRFASRQAFRDHVVPVVMGAGIRWWSLTAKPLYDAGHRHVGWRGVGSDVTETYERDLEMQRLANFDHLTGLANRRQFRASLDALLAVDREDRSAVLYVLDLDNFKVVNDTLGHLIGDQLLREVGRRLSAESRVGELLARLGGDEYALVVPGVFDEAESRARGSAMLDALREPFYVRETRIEIRASVGIAYAPEHGFNCDDLLKAADTALYAAKDAGRNAISLFTAEMELLARKRARVQSELGDAVANDELELHYQPQIDLRSMRVVGFEALLRWRRDRHRLLPPADFISVAEETGLIVPIGTWAVRRACFDAMSWPEDLFVAVNISAVQFASRSLVDAVNDAVSDSGISATRLELEITESSLIKDSGYAREMLTTLRKLGHRVALDDFGTGYSSLAYLRSFPLDKLKVDRAFTIALEHDERGEASAIVRAIIQLASALQLRTVAEGVETQAQLDAVRAKGCLEVQGFLFARPMPAQEISAFLEAWNATQTA